jgi:hypothetical protein
MQLLGIIGVDFDIIAQLSLTSLNHQILEKKWEYNGIVHQLFVGIEKVYDLVRREILYNIFIYSCIPMKLVRVIEICSIEIYINVSKNLLDAFPVQNGLNKEDALLPLLLSFAVEYAIRKD